ncbi:MAG TPA: radical SAM protein [Methylomusa anaerophila]|uniref:(Dimethylallyl)adenosine tRNA methylthiotransferase MiaB n=1 Tax=Methylomusa anaerophila TaxID=1930071 RepID=A0A348ALA0_9FIRM|nr:radical SAM protein [Methylomusa anaerophila]BBB91848.1 (Dimethylallyl)adenosine tRNA methylthiotransferase MiaB [Methylomusa anaerophila]HML88419.1 radical SAM protein [Methylomusa anaerophila]
MKKYKLVLWNLIPFGMEKSDRKYPPLNLGIIASLTPPHWEVVIRDEYFEEFKTEPCDIVGFTAMTSHALGAYEAAGEFKKMGIVTVMGGVHATICTEEALAHVDAVIKGEAEELWGEFIGDFENNQLKRLYFCAKPVNLNKVPKQAFHLYNSNYQWGIVQTTRGCAGNCEFCVVTSIFGATYRKRPIEAVVGEIQDMPQNRLFIADDNLIGFSNEDHNRFKDLCRLLINKNVNKIWITQVPLQFSDDEKMMDLAYKAGCRGVFIGIESGSVEVLAGKMKKHMNVKYVKEGNFVEKINKHGIQVFGSLILGNDEDGKDCFRLTYSAIKRLKLAMVHVSPLVPFPGTPLFKRLIAENRLLYTDFPNDWRYYRKAEIILFKPAKMNVQELNEGTLWLYEKLFSLSSIISRAISSYFTSGNLKTAMIAYKVNLEYRKTYKECSRLIKEQLKNSNFDSQLDKISG